MRGNRPGRPHRRASPRSIPACAGEPFWSTHQPTSRWVYPRVCGGTCPPLKQPYARQGLSPRVRGNRHDEGQFGVIFGSIPACAGEPSTRSAPAGRCGVYPRVCGGTALRSLETASLPGLSPRVRGNPLVYSGGGPRPRSIPACAGEPSSSSCVRLRFPVYPRVCGGTIARRGSLRVRRGLSPRVRGNRGCRLREWTSGRSIPACAGEPIGITCMWWPPRVYPRVCGGTGVTSVDSRMATGLSPRVRGNPLGNHVRSRSRGQGCACCPLVF